MAFFQIDFYSNVLGMSSQLDVIIPQGRQSYQTLYLLHGLSDDHTIWQRRTSIERYADAAGIAVVMPNAHRSWYTDMKCGGRYFTYISEEVPAVCRDFFPKLSDKREDNFVAGLSMGGYGALKIALSKPESFCAAASLSGAVNVAARGDSDARWSELSNVVFGDKRGGSENDIYHLARVLAESGEERPRLYMWCGTEDFLFHENEELHPYLEQLGYDLTYKTSPGNHNWTCWDEKIQDVINWLPIRK